MECSDVPIHGWNAGLRINDVKAQSRTSATVPITIQGFLLNQLKSLVKAGYEVTSISAPGPAVASIEAANIRHIPVPMTRKMKPLADLISLWHLYRV